MTSSSSSSEAEAAAAAAVHPISVLRIGPSGPSATLLKTALLSHFPSLGDVILISNKYFCAQLRILDDFDTPCEDHDVKEDGILLVFDGLSSNPDRPLLTTTTTGISSFVSLTGHHDVLSTKNIGDLLQLCIGVSLTELSVQEWRGKKHEEEYSNRILWCLDREYEYVEANLSQEGQKQGHEDRDKEGFSRIVEAIQGTVWSSAVMDKTKHDAMKMEYEQHIGRDMITTTTVTNSRTHDDDDVIVEELQLKPNSIPLEEYMDEDKGIDDDEKERRKQEKLQADKMDSFESLMRQASDLRDASRGGTLPDDMRRERAADLAVALMNQLGLDDDNDDDSSVEEAEQESKS
jgi:hypothetical protein